MYLPPSPAVLSLTLSFLSAASCSLTIRIPSDRSTSLSCPPFLPDRDLRFLVGFLVVLVAVADFLAAVALACVEVSPEKNSSISFAAWAADLFAASSGLISSTGGSGFAFLGAAAFLGEVALLLAFLDSETVPRRTLWISMILSASSLCSSVPDDRTSTVLAANSGSSPSAGTLKICFALSTFSAKKASSPFLARKESSPISCDPLHEAREASMLIPWRREKMTLMFFARFTFLPFDMLTFLESMKS